MYPLIQTADMIGQPFARGGRDLVKGVDCFGVLMECHRRLGKIIPDFRSPEFEHEMEEALNLNKENGQWTKVWEKTCLGDFAPLTDIRPGHTLHITIQGVACHVAFVFKPDWMIHAWEKSNGITSERISLWKNRIVGVYEFNG